MGKKQSRQFSDHIALMPSLEKEVKMRLDEGLKAATILRVINTLTEKEARARMSKGDKTGALLKDPISYSIFLKYYKSVSNKRADS